MAATKLNPAAAPFPRPYGLHLAPPAPPPFPLADAVCPPQFPFVTYRCVAAPPAIHIGFCFPVQPPPSPPAVCKGGVPAAAVAAAAHGRPPHKLMAAFSGLGGAGKRQAAAAVAVKPWQEPVPAAVAPAALVPAPPPRKPRVPRRKAERSMAGVKAKAPRHRKAAGPRARKAAQAQRESSAPPKYTYTTGRVPWWQPLPEPGFGERTTIMLRNIPNKLRSSDMIELLDQHCKRVNRTARGVVSAYDVLYLPMDFRRECNFGYAFVNFTTAAAARRFYLSLQWCGWTVQGSKKVIQIVPAKIQGREALEGHLRRLKLECAKDEFLPAVFSPPRDGVTAGSAAKRIGRLVRRPATAASVAAAPLTQG